MNYCFSILDGSCVKHENVINSAIPKWQDLVTPGLSRFLDNHFNLWDMVIQQVDRFTQQKYRYSLDSDLSDENKLIFHPLNNRARYRTIFQS